MHPMEVIEETRTLVEHCHLQRDKAERALAQESKLFSFCATLADLHPTNKLTVYINTSLTAVATSSGN